MLFLSLSPPLRLCSRQRRPVIRGDSIFPVHPLDRRSSSHYYKVTNEPRKRPADYPIPLSLFLFLCSSLRFPRPFSLPSPSLLLFSFLVSSSHPLPSAPPLISFPVALRLQSDCRRGSRSQTRDRVAHLSRKVVTALKPARSSNILNLELFMHPPQTSPEHL